MLAFRIEEVDFDKVVKNNTWNAEEKIDGVRGVVFDGKVYSRNSEVMDIPFLEPVIEQAKRDKVVLDGELFAKDFSNTMALTRSVSPVNWNIFTYHIFDCLPEDDYRKLCQGSLRAINIPFEERKKELMKFLRKLTEKEKKQIKYVPYMKLPNVQSINPLHDLAERFIARGYEGIMIKLTESYYYGTRRKEWLKVKRKVTVDCEIVGFEEGHRSLKGTLGALTLKCKYRGKTLSGQVGSGFTKEQRDWIWGKQDKLKGFMVEVTALEPTKYNSLRHPTFKRFRLDITNKRYLQRLTKDEINEMKDLGLLG